MVKWIALSALVLVASGCASVYPQPRPIRPTAVYIADYGIHSSLIIPNGDGRYVEYAFGDWYYAALNHCWPNDALGALLVSSKSTLGRRFIELKPGETTPHPVHPVPHSLKVVYGSQTEVEVMRATLDDRYRRDATQVVHNPDNDMDFVPDSEHYSFLNNCNHLTARCLRQMGCDVRGVLGFSKFRIADVQRDVVSESARTASMQAGILPTAQAN